MAERPLKLLLLSADYPPRPWSGIGRAVQAQAQALARRGHEVHVLLARTCHQPSGTGSAPVAASRASGVIVHHLSRRRLPVDVQSFDRAHLHSVSLGPLALELRRRCHLPLVYTVHGLIHRELAPGRRARQASSWQRRLLASSDAVVFLSQAEMRAGCDLLPTVARRSRVLPNGISADHLRVASLSSSRGRKSFDSSRRSGPIVFAGRFAHSKGIDRLARMAPALISHHRPGLVIAGGHGSAAGQDLVSDLTRRFPASCHSTGWLSRRALHQLFDSAALVLVPSRYEPFGLVALEAMARAAPVLASDVGGLRDLVVPDSGSRRLADPSAQAWVRAAAEMLDDPRVGQRGPDFIRRNFEISRIAERLEQEVYRIASAPQAPTIEAGR